MNQVLIKEKLKKILGSSITAAELDSAAREIKLVDTARSARNNLIVTWNGDRYDSLSEAYYSYKLFQLLKKGAIRAIQLQKRYPLPDLDGKMRFSYTCDFIVTRLDGSEILVELKGKLSREDRIRYAYFQNYYNLKLEIVFTSGKEKFRTDFI